MSVGSSIEWTDATWNIVTGCTKVSEGCRHCYAEAFAHRGMGPWKGRAFSDVRCHEDRLDAPIRWRKPRRVFVNSMSDLFHPDVPDGFIGRVWDVMRESVHTFQILTKRPERMREWVRGWAYHPPLENVWLGVSVEDQATANARLPLLWQTPAALRFVSCEPLLGPVDLRTGVYSHAHGGMAGTTLDGIDWVIVGGESGPKARPCDVAWIRSIVGQCQAASVACFVKQLGARTNWIDELPFGMKSRKGADPIEWPEDLRVREMPR